MHVHTFYNHHEKTTNPKLMCKVSLFGKIFKDHYIFTIPFPGSCGSGPAPSRASHGSGNQKLWLVLTERVSPDDRRSV